MIMAAEPFWTKENTTMLLPQGSWDSHIHVIDPIKFPLDPDRDYTPKAATWENATAFQNARGIAHTVIVLPSVYGTNNSVLLDGLKHFNGSARGVCVIDPDIVSKEDLATFHSSGVRGIRVNFGNDGTDEEIVEAVQKNAEVAKLNDWVLQIWIPLRAFGALHSIVPNLGVRVVVDHFGHTMTTSKTGIIADTVDPYQQPGFNEMVDLLRRRLLFVKISAPYQDSKLSPLYEDMRYIAEILMTSGPDMVVYGSDWPHTASKEGNAAAGGRLSPQEFREVDDAGILNEYREWAGEAQFHRMMVDNPKRLWQFYSNATS